MKTFIPAIVIVAFNRPASLLRLLGSISKASYPDEEIPLCLCIDYQDSDGNREVVRIAEEFAWRHGPKEVIRQSRNLGLKEHVLTCGDLTERFGSIVMLEDDLFVSPGFYSYAVQALEYYDDESRVAGISLYNHKMNFVNKAPFQPIEDGSDVYFLQIASSWGQAWTAQQWRGFRAWFAENQSVPDHARIPKNIISWPDKSWLKHYINYLSETSRTFVFPRVSFTTNFGEVGENTNRPKTYFQVPIFVSKQRSMQFVKLRNSVCQYDAYFDLLPSCFREFSKDVLNVDFTNNLSGLKPVESILTPYVLLKGFYNDTVQQFGLQLKPVEMNIIFNIEGTDLAMVPIESVKQYSNHSSLWQRDLFRYQHGLISLKKILRYLVDSVLAKI